MSKAAEAGQLPSYAATQPPPQYPAYPPGQGPCQPAYPPVPQAPGQPAYPPPPAAQSQPPYLPQGHQGPGQPTSQGQAHWQGPPPFPATQTAYCQPGAPTAGTTVVVAQPVVGVAPSFHQGPVTMTCPHCQSFITTSREYVSGTMTYLVAGAICLFLCWLGCCLIPFCIDDLKDVVHTCPSCGRQVGRYNRM